MSYFITNEQKSYIITQYNKGQSTLEIGKDIDKSSHSIWIYLKKHGVNRNKSEARKLAIKKYPSLQQNLLLGRAKGLHKKFGEEWYKNICIARRSENRSGVNNPNYRHGERIGKYLYGWGTAKKNALKHNNYTCQHCKSTKFLQVHHIIPYRITQNNSLDNLITLCRKCHYNEEVKTWRLYI